MRSLDSPSLSDKAAVLVLFVWSLAATVAIILVAMWLGPIVR